MIVAHLSLSLWYCVQQQDDALHIHSVRRRGGLSISQVGVSRMIWDDAIVTHIAPHTLQVGRIRNEQRVYWHVYHGTNRVTSLTKINSKPLASLEALLVSYSFCNYCWLLQSWANFFQWLWDRRVDCDNRLKVCGRLKACERSNVGQMLRTDCYTRTESEMLCEGG
jgi:hypothetical protein